MASDNGDGTKATISQYSGSAMTLGNAVAARVRLIAWCRDWGH
jgi:hypothetical protein